MSILDTSTRIYKDFESELEQVELRVDKISLKATREWLLTTGLINADISVLKENLLEQYRAWVRQKLYLVLQNGDMVYYTLASKRGNSKYHDRAMARLTKALKLLEKLDKRYFVRKSYTGIFTSAIFVTITLDRTKFLNRTEAWHSIGRLVDNFVRAMEKRYGKAFVLRGNYEAHDDGFPHVHLLFIFEKHVFRCFYQRKKRVYRIYDKRSIEKLFPYGFIDIEALVKRKKAISYAVKYSVKLLDDNASEKAILSLALSWFFRKHGFTFRRLSLLNDLILDKQNSHQILSGLVGLDRGLWIFDYSISIELLGFVILEHIDPKKYDSFCLEYEHWFVKETLGVLYYGQS